VATRTDFGDVCRNFRSTVIIAKDLDVSCDIVSSYGNQWHHQLRDTEGGVWPPTPNSSQDY